MATDPASSLIAQFPNHIIHLTDTSGLPILSSVSSDSPSPTDTEAALTGLTATYLQAQETASRLNMGVPKRITIETEKGGVVVVQSSITAPQSSSSSLPSSSSSPPLSSSTEDTSSPISRDRGPKPDPTAQPSKGEPAQPRVPTLISTIIAPSATQMAEARLATWSVEAMGRKFQKVWLAEQDEQRQSRDIGDEEDKNSN
ncbi:hypothetical protein GP486_007092 [Trichoglossum hirsutum]|uniref:Uncharacterized protein n=1 Tax=Trichoglossum hirsutum TaxID=265104 RepID=A0A9P8ICE5_9PEZI|nr:hypothetical protein GP486_007092 [Trichoglossum hirsutum]